MLRKTLPLAIAGILAAGIALTGCTPPAETPADDTNTTAPTDDATFSTDDTGATPPTPEAPPVTDPGTVTASETVDVTTIGEGSTITYPVGTTVAITTPDPSQWSLLANDNTVINPVSVASTNGAGYDLGLTIAAVGTAEVELYNGATGETLKLTVTGS